MEDTHDIPTPELADDVLRELADELHRLATNLRRDLRRNAVVCGLSDLTAMRPLQRILTDGLTERVFVTDRARDPGESSTQEVPPTDVHLAGYL